MRLSDVLTCALVLTCGVSADMSGHVMMVDVGRGQHRSARSAEVIPELQPTGPPEMTSLHIESDILYRYAKTSVASKLVNKADVAREISFGAILPQSAFISAFHIQMGGEVYHAYVKEKEAARKEYSEAVSQGRTAAKVDLTARDSNRFTVSVNVEANAKITFNLTYEELLTRRLGVYSDVINIDPGQIVPELSVVVRIEESNELSFVRVPTLRVTNEITAEDSVSNDPLAVIETSTPNKATIQWRPSAKQQRELKEDGVKGQLTVEYDVKRQGNPSQILVSDGYFVHFYSPSDLTPLAKYVVFVLDVSGSMHGMKIRQLKEAMGTILTDLKEGDYFSIVLFSSGVQIWLPSRADVHVNMAEETDLSRDVVVRVTPDNIRIAKQYVGSLDANGGTNINDALLTSLLLVKHGKHIFEDPKPNEVARQIPEPMVIFLTDGQANVGQTNTDVIVTGVTQKNKQKASIFCLAFGRDADKDFLKKLSLKNSAFSRLIYDASDAALQLRDFYRQIASPLLANVTFVYEPTQVENASLTNVHFDTLFGGSELVVAGKLGDDSNEIGGVLRAKSSSGETRYNFSPPMIIRFPIPRNRTAPSFMEKLWAYLNIQQLLDKQALEDGGNSTSKDRALAMALKYSFVTPLTSLVVVKPNETSHVDAEEAGEAAAADHSFLITGLRAAMGPHGGFHKHLTRGGSHSGNRIVGGVAGPPPAPPAYISAPRPYPARDSVHQSDPALRAPDFSSPPPVTTTRSPPTTNRPQLPVLTLSDIAWTTADVNNATHVFITRDSLTTAYEIATNQTNVSFDSCDTGSAEPSHCRHLAFCVLPAFTDNFNVYATTFFCGIQNGFAGTCCPDSHPSPSDVSGHAIRVG